MSGSTWIKESFKKEMSPLGEKVADMLGILYGGIYHLDRKSLGNVEWDNGHHIVIKIKKSFATYDFNDLTNLVFLAHWYAIRVEISPCNFQFIELIFHQRGRTGSIFNRHPTIDEAVKRFKDSMVNIPEYQDEVSE